MAIGHGVACPKGKTRKQLKAKKDRHEAAVKKVVRAVCVQRDGHCRLMGTTLCGGPSEHAHLEEWKRARTRGMTAERRHTTEGSMMACRRHHQKYDAGLIAIALGPDGANAPMRVLVDGQFFQC